MNASIDLLEQTHAFPSPYTFKIIGKADRGFAARAVAVIREELMSEMDPPYGVRESVGGRHLSVTAEPIVESARQVLEIYRRLGCLDGLVMLF